MKGLSRGRYDETFAGEDGVTHVLHIATTCLGCQCRVVPGKSTCH